ncbi:hypothetical protein PCE1_002138 [Barthelona sp. PCE]
MKVSTVYLTDILSLVVFMQALHTDFELEIGNEFRKIGSYKGLVAHIISILCSNFDACYSASCESREKGIEHYQTVEERSNGSPCQFVTNSVVSPGRVRRVRQTRTIGGTPTRIQRTEQDKYDFSDQGVRETDIRLALAYGHTNPAVKGVEKIRELVHKYKNTVASNAGVERGFSNLKNAHSAKQTRIKPKLRYSWYVFNNSTATSAISIKDFRALRFVQE